MAKFLDSTENTFRSDFLRPLILSFVVVSPLILNIPIYIAVTVGNSKFLRPFYFFWPGWSSIHTNWEPNLIAVSAWKAADFSNVFSMKYFVWTGPVYAIGFFAIFGLTEESRQRYRSAFWAAVNPCGPQPKLQSSEHISKVASDIRFQRPQNNLTVDSGMSVSRSSSCFPCLLTSPTDLALMLTRHKFTAILTLGHCNAGSCRKICYWDVMEVDGLVLSLFLWYIMLLDVYVF